jgi:hypothetical protein
MIERSCRARSRGWVRWSKVANVEKVKGGAKERHTQRQDLTRPTRSHRRAPSAFSGEAQPRLQL